MLSETASPTIYRPTGVSNLLNAIIHERTGIQFGPDRLDELADKLGPLAEARGCMSLLDYYYLLKSEKNGVEDWTQVMDAISVQETYFWREMSSIEVVVKDMVPRWFQRTTEPLRIWCAACASGEEPYTLAMALQEAGWGNYPIELYASDASERALERARQAVYRTHSFRALPVSFKQKYFSPVEGGWKLHPEISRRVTFQRANLLAADEINHLARAPIVFCRNVFIYFSAHAIRQTLAILAARMPVGGCLFVGAAESLLKLTADFELRELGGAFGYLRV